MTEEMSKERKGGLNRCANMTPEERKDMASHAAKARWERENALPKATHRGELVIGDISIPCCVLSNGTRILSETGIGSALGSGGNRSGASIKKKAAMEKTGGAQIPSFINQNALEPFILEAFNGEPLPLIEYKDKRAIKKGYNAIIFPKICEVWLKARDAGVLQQQQLPKAQKAEMLMRGLAQIGVIALVDEATGYQEDRENDELQKILSAYISEEFMKWQARFPRKFYQEVFRLFGWSYNPMSVKRPGYLGTFTNKFVYEQMPPGVLEELQTKNPKNDSGNRALRHHQFLTDSIGIPHLDRHITKLITIMELSDSMQTFENNFNRLFGKPYNASVFE